MGDHTKCIEIDRGWGFETSKDALENVSQVAYTTGSWAMVKSVKPQLDVENVFCVSMCSRTRAASTHACTVNK